MAGPAVVHRAGAGGRAADLPGGAGCPRRRAGGAGKPAAGLLGQRGPAGLDGAAAGLLPRDRRADRRPGAPPPPATATTVRGGPPARWKGYGAAPPGLQAAAHRLTATALRGRPGPRRPLRPLGQEPRAMTQGRSPTGRGRYRYPGRRAATELIRPSRSGPAESKAPTPGSRTR